MVGGFKNTSSRLAIATAATVFAGGLALTPAQAADLGGDCCADLEERVAELEATTVRSGNRKLRVKLSGQVNTGLLFWDDGVDSDVYVYDNDEASTRIRIDASGTIRPGLTAGLIIEYDVEIAGGGGATATDDDPQDRIQNRRANWYMQGSMGRISIGQGSVASDGAYEVSFANTWVASVGYGLATTNNNSFIVRNSAGVALGDGATIWGTVGTDGDSGRANRVRYDSPSLAGFTMSASWGEDDFYDVAARYAKEFNGLKIAAAFAYQKADPDGDTADFESYGGSIAMLHTPSGFHLQGGYAETDSVTGPSAAVTASAGPDGLDGTADDVAAAAAGATPGFTTTREHYWIAAGIQFRASELGGSDIAIQYINNELTNLGGAGQTAEYDVVGVGFTQDIDAIGGTLYLSYNHHEADFSGFAAAAANGSADFEQVQFGMRLRY